MKKNDMVDLNIRPKGIVTIWVFISLILIILKSIGMIGISFVLVLVFPAIGFSLLLLMLLYGILETIQQDIMDAYRWIKGDDYWDEEEIDEE